MGDKSGSTVVAGSVEADAPGRAERTGLTRLLISGEAMVVEAIAAMAMVGIVVVVVRLKVRLY